ncbi:hypothetical protein BKA07_001791 [Brevibacterium marinum]|uniref:Uncharacterized protein n=1 Tax=Brevibacterium marinum TaxID=418643 RepID=A0A846RXT2_9MICO|nr:hypothetical protein [Brevibacterium marinum]
MRVQAYVLLRERDVHAITDPAEQSTSVMHL